MHPVTHFSRSLLSPLGQYRKSFVTPSKGKRDKSRKRKSRDEPALLAAVPPAPELSMYLDIGLSKVSRSLERLSVPPAPCPTSGDQDQKPVNSSGGPEAAPYAVVFVARSGQSPAFHSHFPQMVAMASISLPAGQSIRLVGFSKACEDRLSSCLGIPRTSCIAIRDNPHVARGIIEFVRDRVPSMEVPWLQEAHNGQFLETKINTYKTPIGAKRAKPS